MNDVAEKTMITKELAGSLYISDIRKEIMTTKELADYLNTSPKVVIENARKCLPDKIIENGKSTYWDKQEITILIQQMKTSNPNQNTFTEAVKAVSTELTPALKIKQAMLLMQEGYEEELAIIKQRAEIAEQKCIEQQPKVEFAETITSDEHSTFDMAHVAQELKLPYGKIILFRHLRILQILKDDNTPYQKYVDMGYFKIYPVSTSVGVKLTTKATQKGIDFIGRVIKCA